MNESGDLYRAIFQNDAHLAPSKGTDGAFRGAILDNATNKLTGQAEFLKVTMGDRELVPDPNGGGTAVVAALAGGLAVGIVATVLAFKAGPHVRCWWVEAGRPTLKAKWCRLTESKESIQADLVEFLAPPETEPPECSEGDRRSA